MAGRQQDVLRLDVPMDDTGRMGTGERVGHLARDPHRVRRRQLHFPAEPRPQGLAVHPGHGVPQHAFGDAGIEQAEDVGVLERAAMAISRWKRSAPSAGALSGRITFSAARRSCLRSWAR